MSNSGVLKGWQDKRLGHPLIKRWYDETGRQIDRQNGGGCRMSAQLMRRFKSRVGLSPHAFVKAYPPKARCCWKKPDSVCRCTVVLSFFSRKHFGKGVQTSNIVSPGQYRKKAGKKINRGFKRKCRLKGKAFATALRVRLHHSQGLHLHHFHQRDW